MPSNFEQVEIPPELRADMHVEVRPKKDRSAFWAALVAVLVIIIGATGMALGVAWWVHPGAGLAILGAVMVAVGILIGFRS